MGFKLILAVLFEGGNQGRELLFQQQNLEKKRRRKKKIITEVSYDMLLKLGHTIHYYVQLLTGLVYEV